MARAAGTGLFYLRPQLGLPQRRTVEAERSAENQNCKFEFNSYLVIDRSSSVPLLDYRYGGEWPHE